MKYLSFVARRYFITAIVKTIAIIAMKIHMTWVVNLLDKALIKRDTLLCKEAKYCMSKVRRWQLKAQRCLTAHERFNAEVKPNKEK